jgi:hypothetical protein
MGKLQDSNDKKGLYTKRTQQVAQVGLIDAKTEGKKSRDTEPLKKKGGEGRFN